MVLDVVTELARKGVLSEMLYADDVVLMSETIEGIRNEFLKRRRKKYSKGLKVNHEKTNVMVSNGHTGWLA